jgi:hypothetical protein
MGWKLPETGSLSGLIWAIGSLPEMKAEKAQLVALRDRERRDRYKIHRGHANKPATMTDEMLLALIGGDVSVCECGVRFIAHHAARYCSASCQKNARRADRLQIKCENCQRPIAPHGTSRKTRRFCTVACKQQDYRNRRKANIVTLTAQQPNPL